MNYDTFFNLGLDLEDKPVPHVRTASGTDMGAIWFYHANISYKQSSVYPTVHCL